MTGFPQFPRLEARDLTGRTCWTPDAFEGDRNLVFVAFRRQQQRIVDSWMPWLEAHVLSDALRFYEMPVVARWWAPLRPAIDGGMAAAIGDLQACRRTLTIYGAISAVTTPLRIANRFTVSLFLMARDGAILDRAEGPFDQPIATRLLERAK